MLEWIKDHWIETALISAVVLLIALVVDYGVVQIAEPEVLQA
jgi:hypothetical protein